MGENTKGFLCLYDTYKFSSDKMIKAVIIKEKKNYKIEFIKIENCSFSELRKLKDKSETMRN